MGITNVDLLIISGIGFFMMLSALVGDRPGRHQNATTKPNQSFNSLDNNDGEQSVLPSIAG
jgi:hypothetical protein